MDEANTAYGLFDNIQGEFKNAIECISLSQFKQFLSKA